MDVCTEHELIECEDCTESGGEFRKLPVREADGVTIRSVELIPSFVFDKLLDVVSAFCTAMDGAIRMESWPAMRLIREAMFGWISQKEYPTGLEGDSIWEPFMELDENAQMEQVREMFSTVLGSEWASNEA